MLVVLPLLSVPVMAGDAGVTDSLLYACSNATDVFIGRINSVTPLVKYEGKDRDTRVLYGMVVAAETNLLRDAPKEILVLLGRGSHDGQWPPIFPWPEEGQRYLLFLQRLEANGIALGSPCFVPVPALTLTALVRERSEDDFNGYGYVSSDLRFNQKVQDELARMERRGKMPLDGKALLCRSVAVFIEKGLSRECLNDLAQALHDLNQSQRAGSAAASEPGSPPK